MNPIDYKTIVEGILGVTRDNQGRVTTYGLMGQYQYQNGFSNTAFAIGNPPQVSSVTGLEVILSFPESRNNKPLATNRNYSEKSYRLSLIEHSGRDGHNAIMMIERSGLFLQFNYLFIPASPEIGNYPQWNATFKSFEFRDRL